MVVVASAAVGLVAVASVALAVVANLLEALGYQVMEPPVVVVVFELVFELERLGEEDLTLSLQHLKKQTHSA